MTPDDQYGYDLFKLCQRIGKSMSYKYKGQNADDITQELCVWGVQYRKKLEPLSNDERDRILRWQGNQSCMAEFDVYLRNSGNWIYTETTVRRVLEAAMTDDAVWDLMPSKELTRGATVNAGGLSVFLWDLKEAYQKLNDRERDLLELRYYDGVRPMNLSKGDNDAISRAIKDLTSALNRGLYKRSEAHQGPGARHAHTAKSARARVEHSYDPQESYEDSTGYRFCGGA
ncbi:hypothetical protein [Streptomyces sp. NPDC127112]|uniref:hypothetical protein n=1 Tax=Streptomyces sp. NPDC127112 TaxID=3345364 RepID=UPI0036355B8B